MHNPGWKKRDDKILRFKMPLGTYDDTPFGTINLSFDTGGFLTASLDSDGGVYEFSSNDLLDLLLPVLEDHGVVKVEGEVD